MSSVTQVPTNSERVATNKLWQAGLVAAVSAVIANTIILLLARGLFNIPMTIPMQPGAEPTVLTLPIVAIFSVVAAVGATILLALLGRFVARPVRVFQIIAVVFLLLSFGGPASLQVAVSTKAILMLMHVVSAVVIVGVLAKLGWEA